MLDTFIQACPYTKTQTHQKTAVAPTYEDIQAVPRAYASMHISPSMSPSIIDGLPFGER